MNGERPSPLGVYDAARYWDLAFDDETPDEVAFVQALAERTTVRRVYEPGCGGGRLLVALNEAGFDVSGCDLAEAMVARTRERLPAKAAKRIAFGDMRTYRPRAKVDLAICPVNTFRHLLTEADALAHLDAVADAVRPGGHYAIGLHLLPPDADEADGERWSVETDAERVTVTLRVIAFDRRRRIERLRFSLHVRTFDAGGDRIQRARSEFDYRIYNAMQIRSLLRKSPRWTLESVHDFWWDLDDPLPLSDDRGDTVLLLRRTDAE